MLEFGIVIFFNTHYGRNYGFLKVLDANGEQTGEEIFFHYSGRHQAASGVEKRAYPFKGDKLAFERKTGERGDVAASWTVVRDGQPYYTCYIPVSATSLEELRDTEDRILELLADNGIANAGPRAAAPRIPSPWKD